MRDILIHTPAGLRDPTAETGHRPEDDHARLREICDRIDALLDAGDLHEARRLSVDARNIYRRLHGIAAIRRQPNGGRTYR
jgi:hypothetical protein